MSLEEKARLIVVPFPVISHLAAAVRVAKLLSDRDQRLSITFLIMKLPIDAKISSYINNFPNSRINFIQLPENKSFPEELFTSPKNRPLFIESQKDPVRDAVAEIIKSQKSVRIAGFVVDMFCTAMIDVANDFGSPAYVFFTCGAASLGLMLHLQRLDDEDDRELKEYEDSDAVISVSTYVNPVPARVWPSPAFDKDNGFLGFIRRYRETKGIIINTFLEFEPHAIRALCADEKVPKIYPVGPILQDEEEETDEQKQKNREVVAWLDEQPDSSVVFLCFGSRGCFKAEQVKEIAMSLEESGVRFLWSLRKPPPEGKMAFPGEYENPGEVLSQGFLERTAGMGKVIGWAPQMAVLSHAAVGGFVSHCGWNSILESIWCGVPMAVWPLAAEQQANAFQLVKDLEMAVEIKIDYRRESDVIVDKETIGKAIKELMDPDSEIRIKVKGLREKSRNVLMEGESSYDFLRRLIDNFVENIS